MRPLAALLAVLLLAVPAVAVDRPASDPVAVTALAVAEDASGTFIGVHATVRAQVFSGGSGQVYVSTKPLAQTDMQGSARLASRVAAATVGATWDHYDYLVSFESDSTVIGGPSAGGVMTVALTVALHNLREPDAPWHLDPTVAGTGTINPDGTIGPVGGIPAKAQGAKQAGLDVATTQVDGRTVAVDMQEHCGNLELTCRPVATLVEFLSAAADVDLHQPEVPVPSTTDYAPTLGPSVGQQVADLRERLAALDADALPGLNAAERNAVRQQANDSRQRLNEAEQAIDEGTYYLAATQSFQGAIAAGRAEGLARFYGATNRTGEEAVVLAALGECSDAVEAAQALAFGLIPDGINGLYAIASAQERAVAAAQLRDQAATLHDQAVSLQNWVDSLSASAFCVERAGTVAWWADLRDAFGDGPALTDLPALSREAIDEARESVAYAAAVLGDSAAAEAAQHLEDASAHAAAGRHAAAVLAAIEAQTAAGVAMQTGAGSGGVPPAVLDAAEQSAARAIAAARNVGVEPMLSVSLVELAGQQTDTAQALDNLWTARSLALLEPVATTPQVLPSAEPVSGGSWEGSGLLLGLAAAAGGLAGAAVALVAVLAVRRR